MDSFFVHMNSGGAPYCGISFGSFAVTVETHLVTCRDCLSKMNKTPSPTVQQAAYRKLFSWYNHSENCLYHSNGSCELGEVVNWILRHPEQVELIQKTQRIYE